MFDDLFEGFGEAFAGEEDVFSSDVAAGSSSTKSKPTTQKERCVNVVRPRGDIGYVGLANQGATCYLNSLIQCLYMTPELRHGLYALTISDLDVDLNDIRDNVVLDVDLTPSKTTGDDKAKEGESSAPKGPRRGRVVPFELSRLFAYMQYCDVGYVSTRALTRSFGWEGGQAVQQQDVQELNRLLFEEIEASLLGTKQQDLITDLYKGVMTNQVVCTVCNNVSVRPESFQDVVCTIRGFERLEDSLRAFVTFESLDGDNQYFCEHCNKKVDARKGVVFSQLPPVLVFSLSRFDYDWERDERYKITTKFAFPFELNMEPYTKEAKTGAASEATPDDTKPVDESLMYELFFVVIHRGGAYGGHYHSLIKANGVWYDFNDGQVGPVTEDDVKKTFGGKTQSAYMIGYRKKHMPRLEHLMQADEPVKEIMDEVRSVQKRLGEIRAENDRIAHELTLFVSTDSLFKGEVVPDPNCGESDFFQLSFVDSSIPFEQSQYSVTVTIDSRQPVSTFIDKVVEKFKEKGVIVDPSALKHLVVLDCSAAPSNVRVHAKAGIASDEERACLLKDVAGVEFNSTLLLSTGVIADHPWNPDMPTPISLRIKYNDAQTGVFSESIISIPEGNKEQSTMLLSMIDQVSDVTNIPKDLIIFESNGNPVDICATFADLKLKHMSPLRVRMANLVPEVVDSNETFPEDAIPVFASFSLKVDKLLPSVCVQISPKATIGQLKKAVFDTVPQCGIELFTTSLMQGKKHLSNEDATLEQVGIQAEDSVVLTESPSVAVKAAASSGAQAQQQSVLIQFVMESTGELFEIPVPSTNTMAECKALVAAAATTATDVSCVRFKRADMFGIPCEYLNRPNRTVEQYHLHDDDKIWVEIGDPVSDDAAFLSSYLVVSPEPNPEVPLSWKLAALGDCSPLLVTQTSSSQVQQLPPNCIALPTSFIGAADSKTVFDLRAAINGCVNTFKEKHPEVLLPELTKPEQLRLWHSNKLLKHDSASLSSLRVVDNPTVFVQVLSDADALHDRADSLLLYLHKLASLGSSFDPAEEQVLFSATIGDLVHIVSLQYEIPPELLRLAVYKPSTMAWRPISIPTAPKAAETTSGKEDDKQKKGTKKNQATLETLLSAKPFNLHDGDSICVMNVCDVPYPHCTLPPLLKQFGNLTNDSIPLPHGGGAASKAEYEERNGKRRIKRQHRHEGPEARLVIQGYARKMLEERHDQLEQAKEQQNQPPDEEK